MSRKKRNTRRRPMLYIDQPDLAAPTPNMQEDYHSPKQKKSSATNLSQSIKRQKSKKTTKSKEVFEVGTDDSFIEENVNQEDEVKTTKQSQQKVPFTEMSLIEQVDYLASSPGFMPKLKCEIITNNERFKGIVRERKEETVYIETFKKPRYNQVLLGDITSIRLLGF